MSVSIHRARTRGTARCCAWVLVAFVSLAARSALADTTVFGPQTYTLRRKTPPAGAVEKSTFHVAKPVGWYILRISSDHRHAAARAVITLNGHAVLQVGLRDWPAERRERHDGSQRMVRLLHTNELAVRVLGPVGASLTLEIIKDITSPTITVVTSPPANARGWHNTTVKVRFICADEGSDVAFCPRSRVVSAEGAGRTVSGIAIDRSGNVAKTRVTLNIDKTAPLVEAAVADASNPDGWYSSPVVVSFDAADALSGVAPGSVSAPITLAVDGSNLSATGQATDLAGNVGSVTRGGINIDQALPGIAVELSSAPNEHGWYNSAVTAHFICTDGLSGVAACEPDQVVATEGANQAIEGTVTDWAGFEAAETLTLSIDLSPPEIVIASPPACSLAPETTISGAVTDAVSGVAGLTINNDAVTVQADNTFIWGPAALQEGLNTFPIEAFDFAGNRITQDVHTRRPPCFPFPQHVSYTMPGTIYPSSRTQAGQDADVRNYYDDWKANLLVEAGRSQDLDRHMYRVAKARLDDPERVAERAESNSEGTGYGMMIAALMAGYDPAAMTIFDGLWEFSRFYNSSLNPSMMAGHVPVALDSDGKETGRDSAFDGDADRAYALILADKQWGSNGIEGVNYLAEAKKIINAMFDDQYPLIGPASRLPMLGDWVVSDDWQTPENRPLYRNEWTVRASDLMLGHFRAYERTTSDGTWSEVIDKVHAVIDTMQATYTQATSAVVTHTGLLPDFIVPVYHVEADQPYVPQPGPPHFLEGDKDGVYDYNSARVPWRLGTDALLNNDPATAAQVRMISRWAEAESWKPAKNPALPGLATDIKPGFGLDGTELRPTDRFFSAVFAAPFGVAAMSVGAAGMGDDSRQTWLNRIYEEVRVRHSGYYEDTVNLLCLLVMTRNFWDPTTLEAPTRSELQQAVHELVSLADQMLQSASSGQPTGGVELTLRYFDTVTQLSAKTHNIALKNALLELLKDRDEIVAGMVSGPPFMIPQLQLLRDRTGSLENHF